MHVQLIAECADEREAEEMHDKLTLPQATAEEKTRALLTQQISLVIPGAIVGS